MKKDKASDSANSADRIGTCKLCLQVKELCQSHYIPKSVYRLFHKRQLGDPVVMTPNLVLSTSQQIRDYLLCLDCEARFSIAEKYVVACMARDGGFPLRDKLQGKPSSPAGKYLRFSGLQAGIDTDKIAYFAISMVWRGAVHAWATIDRQCTAEIVVPNLEALRRYLLGETPLPDDTRVFVLVCADMISQLHVQAPFMVNGPGNENLFEMMIAGILMQVGIQRDPRERDLWCAVHTPDRAIFFGDNESNTLDWARPFHENARIAKNVKSIPRKRLSKR